MNGGEEGGPRRPARDSSRPLDEEGAVPRARRAQPRKRGAAHRPVNRKPLSATALLVRELIDSRAVLYRELRDPLRAWEAHWIAWTARVNTPDWVTVYLARCARRMTEFSIALSEGTKPAATLAQALELAHSRPGGRVPRPPANARERRAPSAEEPARKAGRTHNGDERGGALRNAHGRAVARPCFQRSTRSKFLVAPTGFDPCFTLKPGWPCAGPSVKTQSIP
jgi:hypothetical protein